MRCSTIFPLFTSLVHYLTNRELNDIGYMDFFQYFKSMKRLDIGRKPLQGLEEDEASFPRSPFGYIFGYFLSVKQTLHIKRLALHCYTNIPFQLFMPQFRCILTQRVLNDFGSAVVFVPSRVYRLVTALVYGIGRF